MAFDIKGKLHVISDTKQVSEKFSKREFVLEVEDGKYPQLLQFQLTGDRCGAIDGFQVGDQLLVTFNLRGREWKSPSGDVKFFNSLDVWKVDNLSIEAGTSRPAATGGDGPDSLPF